MRHWCIWQAHGQLGFDDHPDLAGSLLHTRHRIGRGDAQAIDKICLDIQRFKLTLDLRACTVYQHQANTEAAEQGNIIDQVMKTVILDSLAAKQNDHGFAPVRMNIGRRVSEPFDVFDYIWRLFQAGCSARLK
jgi:hypothetical protein